MSCLPLLVLPVSRSKLTRCLLHTARSGLNHAQPPLTACPVCPATHAAAPTAT